MLTEYRSNKYKRGVKPQKFDDFAVCMVGLFTLALFDLGTLALCVFHSWYWAIAYSLWVLLHIANICCAWQYTEIQKVSDGDSDVTYYTEEELIKTQKEG